MLLHVQTNERSAVAPCNLIKLTINNFRLTRRKTNTRRFRKIRRTPSSFAEEETTAGSLSSSRSLIASIRPITIRTRIHTRIRTIHIRTSPIRFSADTGSNAKSWDGIKRGCSKGENPLISQNQQHDRPRFLKWKRGISKAEKSTWRRPLWLVSTGKYPFTLLCPALMERHFYMK